MAAQHRKAGPMKHRNEPRGGQRNEQADIAEEWDLPASGSLSSDETE